MKLPMPAALVRNLWMILLIWLAPCACRLYGDDTKPVTFDGPVAAIFKRHCVQCHGDSKQEAGLSLAGYDEVVKGGSGGVVVVSGRSSASRLIEVITAEEPTERMPPKNDPLPDEAVTLLKAWIDRGIRQNSESAGVAVKALGFRPSGMSKLEGPPPMPQTLPAFEKPKTVRPFPVLALAASPVAPLVAFSAYEAINLVDSGSGQELGALAFPEGEPHVLKFSPSGAVLLAAGGRPVQSGLAVLFDVKTGKRLAELGNEADAVLAADLSADERRVALGGSGRVVKVFSTEDGSLLHTLSKHTDWITALAYSPDGKLLATADRSGSIHLWDAATGGVVLPLAEHKGAIRALSWRADSQVLASSGDDGLIVWWYVSRGWPLTSKANVHPPARPPGVYGKLAAGVVDAPFGHQGELGTSGRDGKARLWADDGQEQQAFSIAESAVAQAKPARSTGVPMLPTRVVFSFDGRVLIAGDSWGRLHFWPTAKDKPPE